MRAGDLLDDRQRAQVSRSVREAQAMSGLHFSVYLGPSKGDPRTDARRLHAAFGVAAAETVHLHVDPEARAVEIVTGAAVRPRLDDRACGLAALAVAATCGGGDLASAIATGLRMLAEHAGGRHAIATEVPAGGLVAVATDLDRHRQPLTTGDDDAALAAPVRRHRIAE